MIRKKSSKTGVRVTFVLPESHGYGQVSVVGDFNGWDPCVNRFQRRNNRTFSTAVQVEPGKKFHFRYLSEDGGWLNEEEADHWEISPFGSQNCVLFT